MDKFYASATDAVADTADGSGIAAFSTPMGVQLAPGVTFAQMQECSEPSIRQEAT